jgi:hypothetical protein
MSLLEHEQRTHERVWCLILDAFHLTKSRCRVVSYQKLSSGILFIVLGV